MHVLDAFHPYLRMLKAYNLDDFRKTSFLRVLQNILYAFYVTALIVAMAIVINLGVWHLFEDDLNISQFSTALALIITYMQMLFIFATLAVKNRKISENIENIEEIVQKRELHFPNFVSNSPTGKFFVKHFI